MSNYKNDKYVNMILKYLNENNLYEELLNNIYICKKIISFKYLVGFLKIDYLIHYDKYVKVDDNMILLSTNLEDFVFNKYKINDIIHNKISDLDFRILLYTNDEFLKCLLDLFGIENDIEVIPRDFSKISIKTLVKGNINENN